MPEFTGWVNTIMVSEKPNGWLKICLNPKDLNQALERNHSPIPTLEGITPVLAVAKAFSKLDVEMVTGT